MMESFKCSKCSYKTTRNYDLTRHLKGVHGIYVKTFAPCKVVTQPKAEFHSPIMDSEVSEEEEEVSDEEVSNEFTENQIENYMAEMKRRKCIMLDRVLALLPPRLKPVAKRICDSHKENEQIFISDKNEVIVQGEVKPGSNILTVVLDELVKSPGNFKEAELQIDTLKYLLAHQTKALERERGVPICNKFKSMFDGTVKYYDDSDSDSEDNTDEEDGETEDDEDESTDDESMAYTDDTEDEEPPERRSIE